MVKDVLNVVMMLLLLLLLLRNVQLHGNASIYKIKKCSFAIMEKVSKMHFCKSNVRKIYTGKETLHILQELINV